ncbi:MAG: ZIP family metal transporter [Armatimonadota bacterium]
MAGALTARRGGSVVSPLVHFAAGAFLALALLLLLPDGAAHAGWPAAILAAVVGAGACHLLARRTGASCPACPTGVEMLTHQEVVVPLLAFVALHSVLDGLPLVSGDHHHHESLVAAAILLHKLPEGLAVSALLRASGSSAARAFLLTAAVEACTFLGVLLGLALGQVSSLWLGLAVAGVAGSFLYVAGLALVDVGRSARPSQNRAAAALGAIVVMAARLALG